MKKGFPVFIIRWLFNSLGLWAAVALFGIGHVDVNLSISILGFLIAGLVFSIVNGILKPIIIVLSLPAIVLTLGLFMLIVNGLMVYISLRITGIPMYFFPSILTGLLLSLVNYIVDTILMAINKDKK